LPRRAASRKKAARPSAAPGGPGISKYAVVEKISSSTTGSLSVFVACPTVLVRLAGAIHPDPGSRRDGPELLPGVGHDLGLVRDRSVDNPRFRLELQGNGRMRHHQRALEEARGPEREGPYRAMNLSAGVRCGPPSVPRPCDLRLTSGVCLGVTSVRVCESRLAHAGT